MVELLFSLNGRRGVAWGAGRRGRARSRARRVAHEALPVTSVEALKDGDLSLSAHWPRGVVGGTDGDLRLSYGVSQPWRASFSEGGMCPVYPAPSEKQKKKSGKSFLVLFDLHEKEQRRLTGLLFRETVAQNTEPTGPRERDVGRRAAAASWRS